MNKEAVEDETQIELESSLGSIYLVIDWEDVVVD